jgi:hypothetical protein
VNRTPALGPVVPVFEGVDVGDVGSRGQVLEEGVIAILAVGAECGKLVGGVGFTAQQEGERHKDSRLYWGSRDEQCSQESVDARGESMSFYGGPWGTTRRTERCRGVVSRAKRGKEDGIYDEGDSRVRKGVGAIMTRGLGLGVLRAGHMRHAHDRARREAGGWCKSRGLEVIRCDIRCEGKSRGRQGGEPEAGGRIITIDVIVVCHKCVSCQ